MSPSERHFSKVGAIAAISGLVIYGVSNPVLHPQTPPHETETAFAHYAVEPIWSLYHLGELLGILLMGVAIIALAWRLRRGVGGVWATLGAAAMVVCASVYAVFFAVDGVALGIMVDRWAEAGPEQQELLYETAFAVRQIEAGLFRACANRLANFSHLKTLEAIEQPLQPSLMLMLLAYWRGLLASSG